MPVTVQGPDGNSYQFPDGTDKAAAIAYFKKKGIGAAPPAAAPEKKGFWASYDEAVAPFVTQTPHKMPHSAADVGREVGTAFSNIGAGGLGVLLHPLNTVGGILKSAVESAPPVALAEQLMGKKTSAEELGEQLRQHPLETVETGIGQAGATAGAGEAVGGVAKAIPKVAGRAVEGLTDTGPKVTRNLAKETAKANEIEEAKTAKAAANEAERGRLQTLVGEGSKELEGRIETAREKALKVGNEKYSAVNKELNPLPADMEKVHNAYQEASSSISDVQSEPPLLKRLGESIQRGDALTYKDEQALYSELGKELSKGTLPGTTYHAYDVLHDSIGDDMQRMADSQGKGAQLTEARAYWKRMKQTFGKPASVRDAASKTLRSISPEAVKKAELENRVRLLSHYDPEIEGTVQTVTEARKGLKSLPKLEPGKSPQTIGKEDIQNAKAESLGKRADWIQHRGAWAATWPVLYALKDIIHGNVEGIPGALGEGAAVYGAVRGVAEILRNPKVVDFLAKATPRDIAEVPPDLRGDLPAIVAQAKKNGIAVSPALGLLVGATTPKKGVAAALSPQ